MEYRGYPPVSVAVPVGRYSPHLEDLLASLMEQKYPVLQVILAHERSFPPSIDLENQCDGHRELTIVATENGTPAALRNAAALAAKHDLLAYIDSDCLPRGDWIYQMVLARSRNRTRVVTGNNLSANRRRSEWAGVAARKYLSWMHAAGRGDYTTRIDTKNMMIETDFLFSLGMFDPDLESKEDRDLTLRVCLRGERIGLAPMAKVRHVDPPTLSAVFRRAVWYARGMRQFRYKYRGHRDLGDSVMFYKAYVGESLLFLASLFAYPFSLVGIFPGIPRVVSLVPLTLSILLLGLSFRSLAKSMGKLLLGRISGPELAFDLVTDFGHKIGYISSLIGLSP